MTSCRLAARLVGFLLLAAAILTTRANAAAPTSIETLRAIALTDQEGRPFTMWEALGHIVVLNFIFTGCGDTCPTQTADLAAIQATLPADIRARTLFLSVSVDPEHDFPAALRAFAEARNVDFATWRFLTGTPDAIRTVVDFYGAVPPAKSGTTSDLITRHATLIHLFAPNGQDVMRYVGAPLDTPRLTQDITAIGQRADNR